MRKIIHVRVKVEGERPFYTTLRRFIRDNSGAFNLSTLRRLRKLRTGSEVCLGGGAAPAFCVTRFGTKSSLGGYSKHNRRSRRIARRSKRR